MQRRISLVGDVLQLSAVFLGGRPEMFMTQSCTPELVLLAVVKLLKTRCIDINAAGVTGVPLSPQYLTCRGPSMCWTPSRQQ